MDDGSGMAAGWGAASSPKLGYYWSATAKDASYVYRMNIYSSDLRGNNYGPPGDGFSVRLFKDR